MGARPAGVCRRHRQSARREGPGHAGQRAHGQGPGAAPGQHPGRTLDGLPGVSSTYFGPNANRPVIRGQDGDRIRVLGNGGASFDASSLSFDHAVPIDPLVVERVEVLRGPAALSYGGSAVGGVVNAIDNRIPREAVTAVSGAVEARLGGAAGERAASALVEGGGGTGLARRRLLAPHRRPERARLRPPAGRRQQRAPQFHRQLRQPGRRRRARRILRVGCRLRGRQRRYLPQRLRHRGRGRHHHPDAARQNRTRR
ncbi:MAG: TonB-dependent receptor plug domain-containing protein [Betaproteobacteria bacterium]|nr:TonB-dependent receptor plug domain-containing protein [Betaproteobacteria bacterium]